MLTTITYMLKEAIAHMRADDFLYNLYKLLPNLKAIPKAIAEIFSKEWKIQAFMYIAEKNDWITGYELTKMFGLNPPSVYEYLDKLKELGVVRRPEEGRGKAVKITDFGLLIYKRVCSLLREVP